MKFKYFSNPFHPGEILLEEFLDSKGLSRRSEQVIGSHKVLHVVPLELCV